MQTPSIPQSVQAVLSRFVHGGVFIFVYRQGIESGTATRPRPRSSQTLFANPGWLWH